MEYEEQLLARAIQGEEEAIEKLLTAYKPLVRKVAQCFYLIGGDTDDLIQEGMIGLYKAIREYDQQKESSFSHFARLCIHRQMMSAVEKANRKKHIPLNSYISLNADSKEEGEWLENQLKDKGSPNPENMVIHEEITRQWKQNMEKLLSKMEREVFLYTIEGLDYREIAQKMEKSPKAIDNALQRIRKKISHYMEESENI